MTKNIQRIKWRKCDNVTIIHYMQSHTFTDILPVFSSYEETFVDSFCYSGLLLDKIVLAAKVLQ